MTRLMMCAVAALLGAAWWAAEPAAQGAPGGPAAAPLFQPAATCMVCHNNLTTPAGEDVSIGTSWRASMMAHSARDPYWQAAVRREVTDHPSAQAAIENECSRCHMPMAHVTSTLADRDLSVFDNIPTAPRPDPLAVEGVSCSLCHQIGAERLGEKASFTGGFTVDTTTPFEQRRVFGPFEVDRGRTTVMRSATGFQPSESAHIQRSEVCATCHTLYTHALDAAGNALGEFPEQVPYQEWLHSEYRDTQSCQSCHMPVVQEPTPIASVAGEPRAGLSRHDFRGANFLMLGVLNRFAAELGVEARPGELTASAARARAFLETSAATVALGNTRVAGGRLDTEVVVRNLAGHKLPTAYPSRRAWLSFTVKDAAGRTIFASGQLQPDGAIAGNDNDRDGQRFEPHYREIRTPDQVQIYETILGAADRSITTGLLQAVVYLKDNRVLPRGFDKATAPADVAVRGDAAADPDFAGGEDRVGYSIDVGGAPGPYTVEAQLWYQPIGYRWAANLRPYTAAEPQRFIRYWESAAGSSAQRLASATTTVGGTSAARR